jgi:hypothetical protein
MVHERSNGYGKSTLVKKGMGFVPQTENVFDSKQFERRGKADACNGVRNGGSLEAASA